MSHDREPIIDAALEEILGGQTPPDLTARILREHDSRSRCVTPRKAAAVATRVAPPSRASQRRSLYFLLASAASFAMALGFASWLMWDMEPSRPAASVAAKLAPQATPFEPPTSDSRADAEPARGLVPSSPPSMIVTTPSTRSDAEVASRDLPSRALAVGQIEIPDRRPSPLPDIEVVRAINDLLRTAWAAAGVRPAEQISEEQWCERLFSKVLGRSPTAAELARFVADKSPDKREQAVQSLTHGDQYLGEFAARWSDVWMDLLTASASRQVDRAKLAQYLRRSFAEGKPLDRLTLELLTATGGANEPNGQSGAASFLLAHAERGGKHVALTGHVARTFLGMSLACAECHDHPTSPLRQNSFWELNAFFRQLKLVPQDRALRLVDRDFAGEGSTPAEAEIYYSLRDGRLKMAYPTFVDGTSTPRSGYLQDVDRRQTLAQFVVRSEEFRQTLVNRYWEEMFGIGFTTPVDDIGPHNRPSQPVLLSKLAGQFAAHDFDARALIRWIALSEPFALPTRSAGDGESSAGELFASFPTPRPEGKTVLESLALASQAYARAKSAGNAIVARTAPSADPLSPASVDRALSAVSANLNRSSEATAYGTLILQSDMTTARKLEHLFFATIHRAPTRRETTTVDKLLASNEQDVDTVLQYVWWALASSREAQ